MVRKMIERNPWILAAAVLAVLALAGYLSMGCSSLEQVNWVHVERELELTVRDLDTLADLAESLEREDRAAQLRDVRDAVADAEAALEQYNKGLGDQRTIWGSLDAALGVLNQIADSEESGDLKIGVAVAQIAIRRLQARFPQAD